MLVNIGRCLFDVSTFIFFVFPLISFLIDMIAVEFLTHLLQLQEDHKFKQAQKIRNPKNRLKKILDACKGKTKCEGGDDIDTQGQDTDEPVKKSRGGCGAQQPKLTIEGMKMVAEYKIQKKKNDDPEQLPEPVERKQQLSAERVTSAKKFVHFFLFLVFGLSRLTQLCDTYTGSECPETYQ